jgi:hypothetical protein
VVLIFRNVRHFGVPLSHTHDERGQVKKKAAQRQGPRTSSIRDLLLQTWPKRASDVFSSRNKQKMNGVTILETPAAGIFLVIAMLEMTDFFQKQVHECGRLAAEATGKNDREYWLRLAQRWEWLLQQNRSAEVEAIRPREPARSVLEKRLAKRQAA